MDIGLSASANVWRWVSALAVLAATIVGAAFATNFANGSDEWPDSTRWIFVTLVAIGTLVGLGIALSIARLAYRHRYETDYEHAVITDQLAAVAEQVERLTTSVDELTAQLHGDD